MYKLLVVLSDGSKITESLSQSSLQSVLNIGVKSKGYIRWANVTTPSGVTHDVTNKLSTY